MRIGTADLNHCFSHSIRCTTGWEIQAQFWAIESGTSMIRTVAINLWSIVPIVPPPGAISIFHQA